jgi:hypothetical protein
MVLRYTDDREEVELTLHSRVKHPSTVDVISANLVQFAIGPFAQLVYIVCAEHCKI